LQKIEEGKQIEEVVMDKQFLKDIITCCKCAYPLINVPRVVDSDGQPKGLIYKSMDQAKEKIETNFKEVQRRYIYFIILQFCIVCMLR
jgi:hypothetical protein